ncbi:309f112e-7dbb-4e8b-a90d-b1e4e3b5027d [Thermothielavioides terrestris]|uniref:309f112e-7dbb-4e8b-a90d-b1e4e3b5027d n=1 Tax=Thermothielavioides terrestris TaxID=2587410 RepID=A0A446BCS6_9PEZI|nr:309f112e-7dbb-4e8b-a90d-b1e4e3b5027d [Thermothielavioides terrestris]
MSVVPLKNLCSVCLSLTEGPAYQLWNLRYRHDSRHAAHDEDVVHCFLIRALLNFSQPGQPRSSSNNFCPSLLYTAALVFNFMNATMYWTLLVPKVLGHGWLQTFSVINMYGVTPLIAIAEVLFLNTITHQHAVARHVLSTTYLLMGYLAWAAIGNTMTGQYPLFWMDPTEIGGAGRVAACAFGFVGLGVSAFAAVYGLTVLREKLAKYATRKTQYSPVPDSEHEHERAADQMPRRRA